MLQGSAPTQVTFGGDFRENATGTRGSPATNALDTSMLTTVRALSSGAVKPGTKLLLDYDFQPGPMG
jgi:hypothetical protein